MNILAVVPARGGSKGIPRKNLLRISGRTLIAHAVDVARDCPRVTHIVVSSDDPEMLAEGELLGCDIHARSPQLAQDTTEMSPVICDVLEWAEGVYRCTFAFVVVLQPTTPFRVAEDVEACIDLLLEGADTVYGICRTDIPIPWATNSMGRPIVPSGCVQNRQKLPYLFVRNGAVYGAPRQQVLSGCLFGGDRRGHVMPLERSVNINTMDDLEDAQRYASNHGSRERSRG